MAPLGSLALAATRAGADKALVVSVGGAIVQNGVVGSILPESLSIKDQVSARSSCEFTISDETRTLSYQTGESVLVTWHGARLFAGTVDQCRRTFALTSNHATLELSCVDHNAVTDHVFVNQVFEDLTVREIVDLILTDPDTTMGETTAALALEGITAGEIEVGPRIDKLSAGFQSVATVFRELAESSGLMWNIDPHKKLHFVDRAGFRAPFDCTDAQAVYRALGLDLDRGNYRNRQILKAGKERTDPQVESFHGDPTIAGQEKKRRRTFNLAFPIGKGPPWYDAAGNESPTQKRTSVYKFPLRVKRNGAVQRLAVKGKAKDGDLTKPTPTTWPQWFYQEGKPEITQNRKEDDALNATLGSDENLQVEYTGTFPFVADVQSDSEIDARRALEGGSGEYVDVETDEELDGSEFAIEKANRLILIHGQIAKEVPYEYLAPDPTVPALAVGLGVAAGQAQQITIAELGIDALYLIDSVELVLLGDFKTWQISVRALAGEHDEDPVDFFRRLVAAGQKITIRENEKIVKAKQFKDTVRIQDDVGACDCSTLELINQYGTDPYTYALFGDPIVVGGKSIWKWRIGRSRVGTPYGV